ITRRATSPGSPSCGDNAGAPPIPALAMTRSTGRPESHASSHRSSSAASVTSPACVSTSLPRDRLSPATFSSLATSRAISDSLVPGPLYALASAAPMPLLAPVITTCAGTFRPGTGHMKHQSVPSKVITLRDGLYLLDGGGRPARSTRFVGTPEV